MKIKIIDSSLIADKSLDIFASRLMRYDAVSGMTKKRKVGVRSEMFGVFESVVDEIYGTYGSQYDKIVICIGCFPLMRMKSIPSLMTRYICKNSSFLRENGISAAQFIDCFEKFIQKICKSEKTQYKNTNVILLKEKYTFFRDWLSVLKEVYGTTIIDCDDLPIFLNNPKFVIKMEEPFELFTDFPQDIRYKDINIANSIVN